GFDEAGDGVGGAAVDGDDGGEAGGLAGGDGAVAQVVAVGGEHEGLCSQLGEADVGLAGQWRLGGGGGGHEGFGEQWSDGEGGVGGGAADGEGEVEVAGGEAFGQGA